MKRTNLTNGALLALVVLGAACSSSQSSPPRATTLAAGGNGNLGAGGTSTSGLGASSAVGSSTTSGGASSASRGGSSTGSGGSTTSAGGSGATTAACTAADVEAIFMQSCGTSLCHEGSAAAAQLDLITPGVESRLKDASSTMCNGWKLVTPGAAEPSLLYQKVVSTTPPCGVPMPPVGPPLAAEQLQCLKSWIESLAGPIPPPMCETCGTTMCIDLTQDASHCGACASPCAPGQICKNSVCEGCPGGKISCGGTCVDVQTSNANCGSCGNVCSSGQTCTLGICQCSSTTAVSFASAVQPILTANCGGGGCHIPTRGARAADGLDLGPGKAYSELVGVASTQCASTKLVEPGNPSGSYLLDKLLGVRICQGTAMPKGKPQLSQQDLDTIGGWICGGAKP